MTTDNDPFNLAQLARERRMRGNNNNNNNSEYVHKKGQHIQYHIENKQQVNHYYYNRDEDIVDYNQQLIQQHPNPTSLINFTQDLFGNEELQEPEEEEEQTGHDNKFHVLDITSKLSHITVAMNNINRKHLFTIQPQDETVFQDLNEIRPDPYGVNHDVVVPSKLLMSRYDHNSTSLYNDLNNSDVQEFESVYKYRTTPWWEKNQWANYYYTYVVQDTDEDINDPHLLFWKGSWERLKKVISQTQKASIREETRMECRTLLYWACYRHAPIDVIIVLIDRIIQDGEDPMRKSTKLGRTPLHFAMFNGFENVDLLNLLLQYECDANAADEDGWTPLHFAVFHTNIRLNIISLLVGAGGKLLQPNNANRTPLDLAKDVRHPDLIGISALVDQCYYGSGGSQKRAGFLA
jgi:hypothetical protein